MSEISFNFKIESDENLSESQVMGEIKNYTGITSKQTNVGEISSIN